MQPLMQRGIRWVRFTCDPLEARLAHLYFHNFHARAVGFVENYFHFNESHLHAGLPQDRLLCRVHLDGQPLPSWREDEIRRVPVPWDIQQLKRQDMAQARTWSDRIRKALVRLITQEGYQVVDFERDPVRQQGSLILQPSPRPVITSYSIHYTKLYEVPFEIHHLVTFLGDESDERLPNPV